MPIVDLDDPAAAQAVRRACIDHGFFYGKLTAWPIVTISLPSFVGGCGEMSESACPRQQVKLCGTTSVAKVAVNCCQAAESLQAPRSPSPPSYVIRSLQ